MISSYAGRLSRQIQKTKILRTCLLDTPQTSGLREYVAVLFLQKESCFIFRKLEETWNLGSIPSHLAPPNQEQEFCFEL